MKPFRNVPIKSPIFSNLSFLLDGSVSMINKCIDNSRHREDTWNLIAHNKKLDFSNNLSGNPVSGKLDYENWSTLKTISIFYFIRTEWISVIQSEWPRLKDSNQMVKQWSFIGYPCFILYPSFFPCSKWKNVWLFIINSKNGSIWPKNDSRMYDCFILYPIFRHQFTGNKQK